MTADRSPVLDLLGRAADLQNMADARMSATVHGRPITPADDRRYWAARLALSLRARIVFGMETPR